MPDSKQRLIMQNLRLAKAAFQLGTEVSGLARQSALNGGIRLSIEAYLVFFTETFKPSTAVLTMASAERFLRSQRVGASTGSKVAAEADYFFSIDSAAVFFSELEPSLSMVAAEWNEDTSRASADNLVIAVSQNKLPYWANIDPEIYEQKRGHLAEHIQYANDLSHEY